MKYLFERYGVLKGQKAIAKYLRVSVSTVKRLQKTYGLPIIIFCTGRWIAFQEELDMYVVLVDKKIRESRAKSKKS